jgi:RNA 3'-terminal phosphate cyclase (ATP)
MADGGSRLRGGGMTVIIDGSRGEGGGQVLRTSLALSLITGKPLRVENVRARRKSPGLLRQHLTAVHAAKAVGDAIVEGDEIGSQQLTFTPRGIRAGDYSFAIGSAGSTTLVLQTILLPLAFADAPSTVTIEGGTHNPKAPSFDFLEHAFLPLMRRMALLVELELVRPGFYPAGGGQLRAVVNPSRLGALEVTERGAIQERRVRAVVANLPYDIARREVQTACELLPCESGEAHTLKDSIGPGNAIAIVIASEHVTEVFTAFGQRGVRAEDVARGAAEEAKAYIESGAAIGEHLADQLLLPMALGAGGAFSTVPLTEHATTNMEVIRRFLDVEFDVRDGVVRVGT